MKVANEVNLYCQEKTNSFATWHVSENDRRAKSFWPLFDSSNWFISQQFGDNLGEKLDFAYRSLLEKYEKVIFLAADSPMITKDIIEKAVFDLDQSDLVINPSNDGGFYLFGGRKCISSEVWLKTKYSRENTLRDLVEKLSTHFNINFGKMLPDVDRVEDIDIHIHHFRNKKILNVFEKRLLSFLISLNIMI